MDYVYNYNDMQFFAETKNDIEERMQRRLTYYRMYLYAYMVGKISKEKTEGCVKKSKMSSFWDKESCLEQKIYRMMTKWKVRHPIMGIVLCTILGSVLLSLVTEIIIDAIIMMTIKSRIFLRRFDLILCINITQEKGRQHGYN